MFNQNPEDSYDMKKANVPFHHEKRILVSGTNFAPQSAGGSARLVAKSQTLTAQKNMGKAIQVQDLLNTSITSPLKNQKFPQN